MYIAACSLICIGYSATVEMIVLNVGVLSLHFKWSNVAMYEAFIAGVQIECIACISTAAYWLLWFCARFEDHARYH